MKATPRKISRSIDGIELEPWTQSELSAIDRLAHRKRIASIRELRLKTIESQSEAKLLAEEQKVFKLKQQLPLTQTSGVNPMQGMIASLAASGMKPAEINKFLKDMDQQTRTMLMMSNNKGQGGSQNWLLPALILQSQGNPNSSAKTLIETIGAIQAISRGQQPNNGGTEMLRALMPLLLERKNASQDGYVNTFFDFLKGELVRERTNQPSLQEQLQATKAMAEVMGMARDAKPDMEFERLKMDFQKTMADTEWNRETARQKLKADIATDKNRMKTIQGLVTQAMKGASPILEGFRNNLTRKAQGNPNQQQQQQQQQQTNPQGQGNMTAEFICPACNTYIPIVGAPDAIVCPSCGKTYGKQPPATYPQ